MGLLSEFLSKWNFKALMHFNTECHHSISACAVTWFILNLTDNNYLYNIVTKWLGPWSKGCLFVCFYQVLVYKWVHNEF